MQIRTLDTRRARDVNQFIQFPFDLYRDCKLWVPPLIADMKLVMNRDKHPFYRHSDAAFLIAEEGSKTLGRVAVLENRNFAAYRQRKTAFFYYFDAIDDADVSTALLNAAFAWARDRGLEDIRGPVGFLQGDGLGLLVEGFEHRPAMGIAYNYAYYDGLMRAARLEKATDFLSGYLPGDYDLPERFFEVAQRVRERRGLWVKSFTSGRELKQWAPRIGEVFNSAFVDDWEYFPMPEADILAAANRLVQVADPRLIKLVMKRSDRGDEIIGFCLWLSRSLGGAATDQGADVPVRLVLSAARVQAHPLGEL